eukprot:m51a1_g2716 hypothetical protein (1192) ;mRNA; r:837980-844082
MIEEPSAEEPVPMDVSKGENIFRRLLLEHRDLLLSLLNVGFIDHQLVTDVLMHTEGHSFIAQITSGATVDWTLYLPQPRSVEDSQRLAFYIAAIEKLLADQPAESLVHRFPPRSVVASSQKSSLVAAVLRILLAALECDHHDELLKSAVTLTCKIAESFSRDLPEFAELVKSSRCGTTKLVCRLKLLGVFLHDVPLSDKQGLAEDPETDFVEDVWYGSLFPRAASAEPAADGVDRISQMQALIQPSTAGRHAAFQTLIELTRGQEAARDRLVRLIAQVLRRANSLRSEALKPLSASTPLSSLSPLGVPLRSAVGYVGLKNHGYTCFANAVMQQLFMIPSFRNAVLAHRQDPASQGAAPDALEERVRLLQSLFVWLQHSQRQSCDASSFFKAMLGKDWNTQQDVGEFLAAVCLALENCKVESALKEITGSFEQECTCPSGHSSVSRDQFYVLPLAIKDKPTLESALAASMESESIEYRCDQCGATTATSRRSFKDLPNTLVIQQKQLDYDRLTQQKFKLYDSLSFPMDLFLTQVSGDVAQYGLVGVIVHVGTQDTECGHYYSVIKERSQCGRWLRFEDATVTEWDVSKGFLDPPTIDPEFDSIPKTSSAYMLFYHRVQSGTEASDAAVAAETPSPFLVSTLNAVRQDNANIVEASLWDSPFSSYSYEVFKGLPVLQTHQYVPLHEVPVEKLKESPVVVMIDFFLETFDRLGSQATPAVSMWSSLVKQHIDGDVLVSELLLISLSDDAGKFRLFHFLVDHPNTQLREVFGGLVLKAITAVAPHEYPLVQKSMTDGVESVNPGVTTSIIAAVMSLLEYTREHWKRFHQYFNLLKEFAASGPQEKHLLVFQGLISCYIDYILGRDSPLCQDKRRVSVLELTNTVVEISSLMNTLASLICCCCLLPKENEAGEPIDPSPISLTCGLGLTIPKQDLGLLESYRFYAVIFVQGHDVGANEKIIQHCSWSSYERSMAVIRGALRAFYLASSDQLYSVQDAFRAIIMVPDKLFQFRTKMITWWSAKTLERLQKSERLYSTVPSILDFLLQLSQQAPCLAYYLHFTLKETEIWSLANAVLRSRIEEVEELMRASRIAQVPQDKEELMYLRDIKHRLHLFQDHRRTGTFDFELDKVDARNTPGFLIFMMVATGELQNSLELDCHGSIKVTANLGKALSIIIEQWITKSQTMQSKVQPMVDQG